jgi:hypothetical protein
MRKYSCPTPRGGGGCWEYRHGRKHREYNIGKIKKRKYEIRKKVKTDSVGHRVLKRDRLKF